MGFWELLPGKKKVKKEETPVSKHFQTFFDQGRIELESRDFDKAVEYFDKAIADSEKTKGSPVENAYVCKARALDGLGRYKESGELYDKAFDLKPDDPQIWFMRGLSYADQGMSEKAIKYYSKAFELNPIMEEAMLAKASLHSRLGQHDKQVECYLRILKANPESTKARQQMQRIQEDKKKTTNRQWLGGITKGMELRDKEEVNNLETSGKEK
ncbi:MAG: tetratricopeptide repeat protein [Candidatus Altiarchaeota archaeon]